MKAWTNRAELIGAFEGEPEYSHTAHDRNFYKARLMCVRHSGKADYIPVIIPESRVSSCFSPSPFGQPSVMPSVIMTI